MRTDSDHTERGLSLLPPTSPSARTALLHSGLRIGDIAQLRNPKYFFRSWNVDDCSKSLWQRCLASERLPEYMPGPQRRVLRKGEVHVACPLAQKAWAMDTRPFTTGRPLLFRDLVLAAADDSLRLLLAELSRIDVLAIDDRVMAPLTEPERPDFWEICEKRYQVRSMIVSG